MRRTVSLILLLAVVSMTACTPVTPAPTQQPATQPAATQSPAGTATLPPAPTAAATSVPAVTPGPAGPLPAPALFNVAWDDRTPFQHDLIAADTSDPQRPD